MFIYQYAMKVQSAYFDPTKPFEKKIVGGNWNFTRQQAGATEGDVGDFAGSSAQMKTEGTVVHNIKRIMKKFNDYIQSNYEKVLFPDGAAGRKDPETFHYIISLEQITCNKVFLRKAEDEIRFSDQKEKSAGQFLKECVFELEQQGFFSPYPDPDEKLYTIIDQRANLRAFVIEVLKESEEQ